MNYKLNDSPLSERTLIRNKYFYNGIKYINDMGHPCEYRLVKDSEDLKVMVKYYRGRLLTAYDIQ